MIDTLVTAAFWGVGLFVGGVIAISAICVVGFALVFTLVFLFGLGKTIVDWRRAK